MITIATIHGIRTDADNWGDRFHAWCAATCGPAVVVQRIDWGWITGLQMYLCRLIPFWQYTRVRRIAKRLAAGARMGRLSIVAHSFGTHLAVTALDKFPMITIDALVLVASVLPNRLAGTALQRVLARGQVQRVLIVWSPNDTVIRDFSFWPYGKQGWTGLVDQATRLYYDVLPIAQMQTDEQHSTYFWREFRDRYFEEWTDFIRNGGEA